MALVTMTEGTAFETADQKHWMLALLVLATKVSGAASEGTEALELRRARRTRALAGCLATSRIAGLSLCAAQRGDERLGPACRDKSSRLPGWAARVGETNSLQALKPRHGLYRELRRRAKRHITLAARRRPKLWGFECSFARAWKSALPGEMRCGEKKDEGSVAGR